MINIINANIVDVNSGKIFENSCLSIRGSRIYSIDNSCNVGDDIFDVKGRWLIPGLIDLHVHVSLDPDPILAQIFDYTESDVMFGVRSCKNMLKAINAGVTTLRDCGSFSGRSL